MILDYMKNIEQYYGAVDQLKEGIAFVSEIKDREPGRYEKGNMYAMVQEGITSEKDDILEAHKKYIDVQCVFEGIECVKWENISFLKEESPYDDEKDFILFRGQGKPIFTSPGMVYILFPHDGHNGCGIAENACKYRKVVLKLLIK